MLQLLKKLELKKITKKPKKEQALRLLYIFECMYFCRKYHPENLYEKYKEEFDFLWDIHKDEIQRTANTIKCHTNLYAVKYWAFVLNGWEEEIKPEDSYEMIFLMK